MIEAKLVWDGGDVVRVPEYMGVPLSNQMTGTTGERLVELATRVCYDSLGVDADGRPKGRSTENTLGNVLEVKHHSVLEHFVLTVQIEFARALASFPPSKLLSPQNGIESAFVKCFLSRPGVHARFLGGVGEEHVRITANLRAVVEWAKWTRVLAREQGYDPDGAVAREWNAVGKILSNRFNERAPLLAKVHDFAGFELALAECPNFVAEPATDAERHVTVYLRGSRGFSHEQVRHRFAVSQRSTRYCPEGSSPWAWHPLFLRHASEVGPAFSERLRSFREVACNLYNEAVDTLETWLAGDGPGSLPLDTPFRARHARKQARGAARGVLGNALETQLLFTAPVWAWRHIFDMRAAEAADAEIRVVMAPALEELKASRHADRFADLELEDAKDGMGACLKGGGHA